MMAKLNQYMIKVIYFVKKKNMANTGKIKNIT